MQGKIIPDIVERMNIASVTVGDTILTAAKKMADAHIAALIIVDADGMLIGIITERDLTQKVLAAGKNGNTTIVGDIMTANPDTLAPDDSARDALELMQTRGYRHLPVAEDGKCVSIVSIRDLYASVKEALEKDIEETQAFVFGDRYGA
ncbi:MAG: CBS domain-containing protein [Rhodospirillaceae bacterium]|jgi:CBS domain-containing protein|nr:CBS domain-containing protein [Rhodospirillaceae bacterium]MBT3909083.1 CBS domain-containing protein [Rhodospirillaceae bacterium]MBT5297847.1 CBS domain-containing protein [Rhodospirillaceae bacterium]MBT5515608.1 CBS domain-containing protein [Rhodospirillaceae bacterium]MBT6084732.1 CBS domain-containing protein [Rhodospirillaceae bacterium]